MVSNLVTHRNLKGKRGFTLIELIVISGIIVVVTGIVLSSNTRFGGIVLLENLAYDVALSVRQAQVFGISVARYGADTFSAGYGASFQSGTNTYAIFADVLPTENGTYECPVPGSGNCELVAVNTLATGYTVSKLCSPAGVDTLTCTTVSKIDVRFKRPEPDAWISADGASCVISNANCKASARIVLQSPRGDTMSVIVEANGQIFVRRGTQ